MFERELIQACCHGRLQSVKSVGVFNGYPPLAFTLVFDSGAAYNVHFRQLILFVRKVCADIEFTVYEDFADNLCKLAQASTQFERF